MDSQVDQWTPSWNYFKSLFSLGDRADVVEYKRRGISTWEVTALY